MNRPAEAEEEFERTLMKEPNRFRALAGAARAAQLSGDRATGRAHYAQLLKVAAAADRPGRLELAQARQAVAER